MNAVPMPTVPMNPDDAMRSHFWWRPGWAPGRAYLTFHVLPGPAVLPAVRSAQARLRAVGNLSLVAPHRLHVTGPGVGFADSVPAEQVGALLDAAGTALTSVEPFAAPIGPPEVADGSVYLPLSEPRLAAIRAVLREAMRSAGIEPPGDDDEPYRPHLSIAYATGPGSQDRVRTALAGLVWAEPAVAVGAVHLLALRMGTLDYEWDVVACLPLGPDDGAPAPAVGAPVSGEPPRLATVPVSRSTTGVAPPPAVEGSAGSPAEETVGTPPASSPPAGPPPSGRSLVRKRRGKER